MHTKETQEIDLYIKRYAEDKNTWTAERAHKKQGRFFSDRRYSVFAEILAIDAHNADAASHTTAKTAQLFEWLLARAVHSHADLLDIREELEALKNSQHKAKAEEMDTKELARYIERFAEDENTWTAERAQTKPARFLIDRIHTTFAAGLANNTTAKIAELFVWLLNKAVHASADLIDARAYIEKLESELDTLKLEHLAGSRTPQQNTQHNNERTSRIRNKAEALNVNFALATELEDISARLEALEALHKEPSK